MKTPQDFLNYALEFYDDDKSNKFFAKLYCPHDWSSWVVGPDCNFDFAIFPVEYTEFIKTHKNENCFRVVAVKLTDDAKLLKEIPDQKIEMTACELFYLEDAQQIAKDHNCTCFYWVYWDVDRWIKIYDANFEMDCEYYYCPSQEDDL